MVVLTVSLVTYKPDFKVLREALDSVLGSDIDLKLFIIDNSPSDALASLLPKDDRIEYSHQPSNPGFGKAHNQGIRKAIGHSRYHLVLNPDVQFTPTILRSLCEFMDGHPEVGLVAPKVTFPDGRLQPLCKLLPSPLDVFLRRLLPDSAWMARRNERYELHGKAYDRVSSIPYLSGCFMFIRTSIFHEVGMFDERFFMYFEDTDLSRRIFAASTVIFLPQVQIVHHYEKASYRNYRLLWIHVQSAIRYFNKWGWIWDKGRREINIRTLMQFDRP